MLGYLPDGNYMTKIKGGDVNIVSCENGHNIEGFVIKNGMRFATTKTPDNSELIEKLETMRSWDVIRKVYFEGSRHLIEGKTQSGKTGAMTVGILKAISEGYNVILMVEGDDDINQYIKNVKDLVGSYANILSVSTNPHKYSLINNNIKYLSGNVDKYLKNPHILLSINHRTQLSKVAGIVEASMIKYCYFVDEADKTFCEKDNVEKKIIFDRLRGKCKSTIYITATSLEILKHDNLLEKDCIHIIEPSENYCDFTDIKHVSILPRVKEEKYDQIIEPLVKVFSRKPVVMSNGKKHPIVCLNRTDTEKEEMMIVGYLIGGNTDIFLTNKYKTVVIVKNSNGAYLYTHKRCNLTKVRKNGFYEYRFDDRSNDVMSIMDYVVDMLDPDYIVLNMGFMASRGKNMCTSDRNISLTDIIMYSTTVGIKEDDQVIGRHTGNYPTKGVIKKRLFCPQDTYDGVRIAHESRYGPIQAQIESSGEKRTVDIFYEKMETTERLPKKYSKSMPKKIFGVPISNNVLSEGMRRIKEAYYKKGSKVNKLIELYVREDYRGLSKEDLNKEDISDINIHDCSTWKINKGRFVVIYKDEKSGLYILHPEVIKYLGLME